MQNATATLYCPNPACQAPNSEGYKFCQTCRTPLPKRYLWAVGKGVEAYRPGDLLAGRYLLKRNRVLLDTHPGLLPDPIVEIPHSIEPYLRLSPYRLHVPQVYGLVPHGSRRSSGEIILLEAAPIYSDGVGSSQGETIPAPLDQPPALPGQLMPELANVWRQSSALRQITWLWQIAQLWDPLTSEGAAATLLTPSLVRVEGSLLRLLELRLDPPTPPTLLHLGQRWQPLVQAARPELKGFLEKVCQGIGRGQITTIDQLLPFLDRGLAVCGQAQSRQFSIATRTDQGPSRQRNEDACYPPSGSVLSATLPSGPPATDPVPRPLVIVCDGIGGHEGGDVASNLAIEAIQHQVSQLPPAPPALDPAMLTTHLKQAACNANDLISQRNDLEQRQERQRMGTTLVMSLIGGHECYITHVGDSRAYRITRTGCHQITLDDDVASREVRLGYSVYRDALQQAASGSLVQALGMSGSDLLHPTVQRFVLDEDCLFLLCSDGLSDHDRVEEVWENELLPILLGKVDVATIAERLVTIANTHNGHDNVTVGLIHCRVTETGTVSVPALMAQLEAPPPAPATATAPPPGVTPSPLPPPPTPLKTQVISPRSSASPLRLVFSLLVIAGLVGALAYVLAPRFGLWTGSLSQQPEASPSPVNPPSPPPSPSLPRGALIQLLPNPAEAPASPLLLSQPQEQNQPTTIKGMVPVGSVVQIVTKLESPGEGDWLQVKVCSVPPGVSPASTQPTSKPTPSPTSPPSPNPSPTPESTQNLPLRSLEPGETGWILEQKISPLVSPNLPQGRGACR